MKVIVDSNLKIGGVFEPPMELNFNQENVIVKDVLRNLAILCGSIEILGKNGSMGRDIEEIFINEKNLFAIEKGLLSTLKEGDRVKVNIMLELMGGG